MGLDQYGMIRDKAEEIMYWRKHNRLQGWMADLYEEKTGETDMNCRDLKLTEKDIDNLEQAIKDRKLPETEGFFYGDDSYEEHYEKFLLKDDLAFVKLAREALENGKEVIYTCWW